MGCLWSIFLTNLLRNICLEAINSKSCSHAFVPGEMLELEIDRKRSNYNENLKFMPFGNKNHFYTIWELCHLGSYPLDINVRRTDNHAYS